MSNRNTIYLPDVIREKLGPIPDRGLSTRIAGVINDWHCLTTDAMPELTRDEWLYLMDMLNGVVIEGRQAHMLASDVMESGKYDSLGSKWGVDVDDFAQRIHDLPLAGKIAIHDVAYRFWNYKSIGDEYADVLTNCGARLKDDADHAPS